MSNSLDPDQDLVSYCLQILSAMTKVASSKESSNNGYLPLVIRRVAYISMAKDFNEFII